MLRLTPLTLSICLALSSPAWAIDCTKAKAEFDKFICSDAEMVKADTEMNATFFKLLTKTKDKEFHKGLVDSQRRWLSNRTPDGKIWSGGAADEKAGTSAVENKKFVIDASVNRKEWLESEAPIDTMKAQRKIHLKDGQVEFAGYSTGCSFVEPPWGSLNSYDCVGVMRRQYGSRVCVVSTEWASGHITYVNIVSEIVAGKLKHIATCRTGYGGNTCPGSDGDDVKKWKLHAKDSDDDIPEMSGYWKYDPDADTPEDSDWLQSCLHDKVFPPANELQ